MTPSSAMEGKGFLRVAMKGGSFEFFPAWQVLKLVNMLNIVERADVDIEKAKGLSLDSQRENIKFLGL